MRDPCDASVRSRLNSLALFSKKWSIFHEFIRLHFFPLYVVEDLNDVTSCKCVNGGVCDENLNCICSESFTGSLCEIPQLEKCRRTSKCKNGGICIGNKCTCAEGYTGDDCSSCEYKMA